MSSERHAEILADGWAALRVESQHGQDDLVSFEVSEQTIDYVASYYGAWLDAHRYGVPSRERARGLMRRRLRWRVSQRSIEEFLPLEALARLL